MIQTPLPLLAAMSVMMGVMSICIGLVAEIVVRTYFESQGKSIYHARELINLDAQPATPAWLIRHVRTDRLRWRRRSAPSSRRWPAPCSIVARTTPVFISSPSTRSISRFRRLAVVDIAGGHQPMWNEDALGLRPVQRRNLQPGGTSRRTPGARVTSSAATIPTPKSWCTATRSGARRLPARLNGMFAFVVWDRPRRRLFAARDRFGEKPFFYAVSARLLRLSPRSCPR